MKYQIVLLVSLGTLLLQGKCMGQGERMLFDEYKEAIQNYIMTGHEKGWMQCDILSDGISLEPGRQMHENTPYISMDMGKIERLNMEEKTHIANVTFASSHCLLAIYNVESKASLLSILDFGKAAFSYARLALLLKLNSGITLDMITNVTKLPFLVAAESNDRNRQFLCPVVGENVVFSHLLRSEDGFSVSERRGRRPRLEETEKPFEMRKRCANYILIQAGIFMTKFHFCLALPAAFTQPRARF